MRYAIKILVGCLFFFSIFILGVRASGYFADGKEGNENVTAIFFLIFIASAVFENFIFL